VALTIERVKCSEPVTLSVFAVLCCAVWAFFGVWRGQRDREKEGEREREREMACGVHSHCT